MIEVFEIGDMQPMREHPLAMSDIYTVSDRPDIILRLAGIFEEPFLQDGELIDPVEVPGYDLYLAWKNEIDVLRSHDIPVVPFKLATCELLPLLQVDRIEGDSALELIRAIPKPLPAGFVDCVTPTYDRLAGYLATRAETGGTALSDVYGLFQFMYSTYPSRLICVDLDQFCFPIESPSGGSDIPDILYNIGTLATDMIDVKNRLVFDFERPWATLSAATAKLKGVFPETSDLMKAMSRAKAIRHAQPIYEFQEDDTSPHHSMYRTSGLQ